ncbi:MFS transporter [Klebsiella variicola]|uniref:MFS transporter n=1 Tax=Klebsiella variicola TaxID=244366 RepID=A0A7H4MLF7_KLEVA|nr:MFS transporter [Klebsiella variicola]
MKINFPLLALAIGAFGIGTTEFSPNGIAAGDCERCGRLNPSGGNADQCVCHRRHGRRAV